MIKSSLEMMPAGFAAKNPEGPVFFVMAGRIKCVMTCFQIPWEHYISKLSRYPAQW
jgi:hypothetical protein